MCSFALLWLSAFVMAQASADLLAGADDLPEVDEIVASALERAQRIEERWAHPSHTFEMLQVEEKLHRDRRVKKTEERLFRIAPLDGVYYSRLVEKDGRPLTRKERDKERKREKKFRRRLAKGEEPEESEEEGIRFDEELMGRYDLTLEGLESVNGRPAYVLVYRPKPGKLPARRRIDRALNRSQGKLWIDTETSELAALEFELTERVKIWWGLIGSISAIEGRLERAPVEDDEWFPSRFDLYINGRALFRSLHSNQRLRWSNFERLSDSAVLQSSVEDSGAAGHATH